MTTQAHPEPITLTEEQLTAAVCSYYCQLRSDSLPALTHHIPAEFLRIQKQIIEVVELRKNMERVLEVQALQAQHFPTVQQLLQTNKQQEQVIGEMTVHIKSLDSGKMEAFTDSLLQNRQEKITDGREIIQKGQQIVLELNDFKRTFTITPSTIPHLPIEQSLQTEPQGLAWQHEQHFAQLMRWQQRRWQLAKFIYSVKLKELNLRDQLLQERERAQVDFERVNQQLIDTLLREKERDKNLRKKDKETFGEIIKQRDEIDFENENLSHSEKSLLPHLQNELIRLKKRLKQQEENQRLEQQRLQKKNEELVKEVQQINVQYKAQESENSEKEAMLRQKLNELQLALEASSENRRTAEGTLKASRVEAGLQLERAKSRVKQLEHQNAQLVTKNDHLQSQYSQLILKSSQLNQIKGDLAQKFDKAAKRAQQVEGKLEELKTNLDTKEQELRSMQSSLQALKSEKEHYQGVIGKLEGALDEQKNYVRHYEDKTTVLESELTQNFILHNEQRANLLLDLEEKTNNIQQLKSLLQHARETTAAMPAPASNELSPAILASIKEEVLAELARSEKIKLQFIDSFVGRIQSLV